MEGCLQSLQIEAPTRGVDICIKRSFSEARQEIPDTIRRAQGRLKQDSAVMGVVHEHDRESRAQSLEDRPPIVAETLNELQPVGDLSDKVVRLEQSMGVHRAEP